MNKQMRAPDLLRSAARLVEEALKQMDMTETACTCGARHFHNPVDAKVHEQFSETPRKLRDAADRLTAILPVEATRRQR
jgi:hypothetical protein